jgi:hypothetical protein
MPSRCLIGKFIKSNNDMEVEDEDAKLGGAGCGSEAEPQNEPCMVVYALRLAWCLRYMEQGWSMRATRHSRRKSKHCAFHGVHFKGLSSCRVRILISYLVICVLH